ncbi:hypothetical protein COV20_05005 [Candidatus Woesearchaeota archaeon CG10_big_fil_rev_8_21_14_0_10_45_16]|nr:MAG: hypothetical protein COV20_05005 [Candidatus Woesearchaeota archaeon CG10_big_fil_rev_8_21_14_0_10_45_16]
MQKIRLANGLTVLYEKKKGNAVVIEVMINVGSNDELPEERGLSHFLEHVLFEGTAKRPTNQLISNEIESLGGDFNAYTTNERTIYYVKVVKKHFAKGVEVLADILQNSLLKEEHIEKEKKIVLKEIDMIDDEPRYYQWHLLHRTLYKKHPCRFPTYGDRKVINNLTRKQIQAYLSKYYVPGNMTIAIVGDIKGWQKTIKDNFMFPKGKIPIRKKISEPAAKKMVVAKEKKKITNTHLIYGFKTIGQPHKNTYALEVINAILGRGQSGKMFTEIRSKRGLAYEVGTEHVAERSFGYFAAFASIDKKNLATTRKVIEQELENVQSTTEKDLQEAKTYLEGEFLLDIEDVQKQADQLLFWEQVDDAKRMKEYVHNIRKVTLEQVKKVAKKYFKNPAVVIVEGR